mmetsp:Transcript_30532/g.98377  ORF Transcript_30532/g.98377 Transcript_30532/m.98377 type:complete len:318 (-) Transcript_30532:186-1139(-)
MFLPVLSPPREEGGVSLVDRVVGEVAEQVSAASLDVLIVRLRAEASESVLVEVEAEGVKGGHEHVQSHVELPAVDEQRLVDVLLHHTRARGPQALRLAHQLDPLPPRRRARLHDVGDPARLLLAVRQQPLPVLRMKVSLGQISETCLPMRSSEGDDRLGERVFSAEEEGTREVADALEHVQLLVLLLFQRPTPPHVPSSLLRANSSRPPPRVADAIRAGAVDLEEELVLRCCLFLLTHIMNEGEGDKRRVNLFSCLLQPPCSCLPRCLLLHLLADCLPASSILVFEEIFLTPSHARHVSLLLVVVRVHVLLGSWIRV